MKPTHPYYVCDALAVQLPNPWKQVGMEQGDSMSSLK